MGHDDPKHPHHHHEHVRPPRREQAHSHEHDDLIASPIVRRPAGAHEQRKDEAHGHVHHAEETDAQEAPHSHPRTNETPRTMPTHPAREAIPHGAGVGKLLHFDCFSGIAGDMIVGSLLDLGVPVEAFRRALEALPFDGYSVSFAPRVVSSIAATKFIVDVAEGQPFRRYADIRTMLESSGLPAGIKRRALDTFRVFAVAEGKIHRIAPDEVHFHEVGAVDAIVDIVAACAGFEWLGARLTCGPLPMGRGFAKTEHGIIPLPAPAVVEVLQGVPTESASVDVELVTPTGAALMRANVSEFTRWPSMRPVATGFGAGTRVLADRPNLVRVVLGDPVTAAMLGPSDGASRSASEFSVLESNLDDTSGEQMATVVDALLREGALDAWTSAIGMKKGRPGFMVCALARSTDAARLARVLLSECPTLGVRVRPSDRVERPRRSVRVETSFGPVDVKVSDGDGLAITAKPEHEVVEAIARDRGVPSRVVAAAALAAFWAQHGTG